MFGAVRSIHHRMEQLALNHDGSWSRPSSRTLGQAAVAALLALSIAACRSDAAAPAPAAEAKPRGVRMALSAAFVSEAGVPVYRQIADYLKAKTGGEVELVNGLSYDTINKMIASGDIDAAFVCGLPYTIMHDKPAPEADLIVAPVMKNARYGGKAKYFSDLIVRTESPYKSLEDLKGKTYVFNETLSNSGYNLPRYRLVSSNLMDGFFGTVKRSGSHEESIRMVASGEADASYVDSLVLEFDQARGGEFATKVHVIDSIGPAGIPPVVVSTKLDAARRKALTDAFLGMNADPAGRKILDTALVDKFVVVDDHNFDDIREMKRKAEQAGYLTIK
jgi:phosphonate transport system substrate-binding protein